MASVSTVRIDPGDLALCPYFLDQNKGTCHGGCYSEPSCITDRPRGGWPSEVVLAMRRLWGWEL